MGTVIALLLAGLAVCVRIAFLPELTRDQRDDAAIAAYDACHQDQS